MGALFSVLLGWFHGKTILEIAIHVAKWFAFVALIKFVLFVALGSACAWATGYVIDFAMQGVQELYADSGLQTPATLQLVGLAGWLAEKMRIPEVFSILMTGWSFAFVRSCIPFL
jgi:hypothetical protein